VGIALRRRSHAGTGGVEAHSADALEGSAAGRSGAGGRGRRGRGKGRVVDAQNTMASYCASSFFGLSSDGAVHRGKGMPLRANTRKTHAGSGAVCAYKEGDIVTCVVDLDGGIVVFLVNGVPNTHAAAAAAAGGACSTSTATASPPSSSTSAAVARSQLLNLLGLSRDGGVSDGHGGRRGRGGEREEGVEGGGEELDAEVERRLFVLANAAIRLPPGIYVHCFIYMYSD